MRAWKGPEMEGKDKGKTTLFIQDSVLDVKKIIQLLDSNPDCGRLYLGAGRTDVVGCCPLREKTIISDLVKYCRKMDIKIIVEVSAQNLEKIPSLLFDESDQIIVRILDGKFKDLSMNDYIKIDDFKTVRISQVGDMVVTDLSTLNTDLQFSVDIVLYDDNIKEGYNEDISHSY